jgi:hypothetical protein
MVFERDERGFIGFFNYILRVTQIVYMAQFESKKSLQKIF